MNTEEKKKLAARIWAHHGEALEFLLERKPSQLSKLRQSVFSERFLSELTAQLRERGAAVEVTIDSSQGQYVNLAISEWDAFEGMRSAKGWRSSGRAFLFEAEMREALFSFRAVIGPSDRETRNRLIEAVKASGAPLGKTKFTSDKFTRVNSRPILKKSEMSSLVGEGADEDDVRKIQNAISAYMVSCVPMYHNAFQELLS